MNSKLAKRLGIFLLTVTICACAAGAFKDSRTGNCPAIPVSTKTIEVPAKMPNSKRGEIYLNGVWKFIPAIGPSEESPPQDGWGSISVPGDWQREKHQSVPGLISRGTGKEWDSFDGKQLSKAWYQRTIAIPADWQGRTVVLDISRLSTDALVYVSGIQCGQINWPYGAADITKAVKPGSDAALSLLVAAASNETEKTVIMGPNEVYKTAANLESRGLIGEVRLLSLPAGPRVSDVFVQPSTRRNQLKLDVELASVTSAGTVQLTAKMLDSQGQVERAFTATASVEAKPTQTLQVTWDWPNPRLWDIGSPNLYTLRLEVKGSGIDDEYDLQFGFREFWIEGRKFYLNGKEIRLRPVLHQDEWQGWAVGVTEVQDRMIDGYLWAGFNIAEMWPWNHYERGKWHFRELFAERADLKGFPLIGPSVGMSQIAFPKGWSNLEDRQRWETQMLAELRRYRNHPSILMWANSPNAFGHGDDQNPLRIGKKKVEGQLEKNGDWRVKNVYPIAEQAIGIIKQYDPTRPVLVHQGGPVGDVYALNSYLNMIPLQEREEWLSEWAKNGDMPYMVVEFGTPLHTTMMRGRNGFRNAIVSEPLMTEFSAIYFGKQAYELETPAYRQKIRELFVQDQQYRNWQGNEALDFAPAFQKLQELFSTNTWRSWRTFGITGGMVPWSSGHGWQVSDAGRQTVDIGPFKPDRRGVYLPKVRKSLWHSFQMEANIIHPGGRAILQNNGPTLAWIAGPQSAPAAKDRSFVAGEKLQKQVVLINDTGARQEFSFNWEVFVGGKPVATGSKTGSIETAQTLFFPLEVNLPAKLATEKVDGEIRLTARFDKCQYQDNFAFRVFEKSPAPSTENSTVAVFDPAGKTARMLQQLGYTVVPWDGSQAAGVLAIGREALSRGNKLPGSLEAFVRNGGRAIVFTQNPEWMRSALGFRVAPHLSRRVFPVEATHPAVRGLDELDLRDWTGESTLVEAYPNTLNGGVKLNPYSVPWYGWHWGNRGAVSSAPVEKPHLSGWRPILESEFDLAYTPLMELDYGQGRLIWNALDLEDHVSSDPAAASLARQIVDYAQTAVLTPITSKTVLIGSDADAAKLDRLGLVYQRANAIANDAGLVIVGAEAFVSDQELRGYLSAGGKVFFLPRRLPEAVLGISVREVKNFGGSLKVPSWAEARGLSASDLRLRAPMDAWLIESGGEVAADGLLSRAVSGKGVAIFSQIDPDGLNADVNTYFRYTRWRQTRALAQILANMGASFKADSRFFQLAASGQADTTGTANPVSLYHPDYRTDFDLGDDPYRYYRW
ncbi:MAG: beta-galactosidase [Oscillatoria sp. Prado101]|nr:beta-galactosidase [Oscillatoria sp. Prado101]